MTLSAPKICIEFKTANGNIAVLTNCGPPKRESKHPQKEYQIFKKTNDGRWYSARKRQFQIDKDCIYEIYHKMPKQILGHPELNDFQYFLLLKFPSFIDAIMEQIETESCAVTRKQCNVFFGVLFLAMIKERDPYSIQKGDIKLYSIALSLNVKLPFHEKGLMKIIKKIPFTEVLNIKHLKNIYEFLLTLHRKTLNKPILQISRIKLLYQLERIESVWIPLFEVLTASKKFNAKLIAAIENLPKKRRRAYINALIRLVKTKEPTKSIISLKPLHPFLSPAKKTIKNNNEIHITRRPRNENEIRELGKKYDNCLNNDPESYLESILNGEIELVELYFKDLSKRAIVSVEPLTKTILEIDSPSSYLHQISTAQLENMIFQKSAKNK
jgi:hypothetical protein